MGWRAALLIVVAHALSGCGAAPEPSPTASAQDGATVRLTFPELPAEGDATKYLVVLFSAKDFAARNQRFRLEAKAKVDTGPVAPADYDVNVELRNVSNSTLEKSVRLELTVAGRDASATVKFAEAEPIPLP
jgi:hypothetical protein